MPDPQIFGKPIPDDTKAVLLDIMEAAGVASFTITRTASTPQDQARVMYQNLISTGINQGIPKQRALYLPPGNKVIDVFEKNQGQPRDTVIALMAARIVELGPQTVSHHCCDPDKITVLDIAPTSIDSAQHAAFEAAVRADPRVSKFLTPASSDPAYHLEIPRIPA